MRRGYSKVLTAILIIIIVAIIGLLGFLGYNFYKKNAITNQASEYVDSFEKQITAIETPIEQTTNTANTNTAVENTTTNETENTNSQGNLTETPVSGNTTGNSTTTKKTSKYNGFEVLGTIEIPKTNVKYPVLAKLSAKALDTAVCAVYPQNAVLNTIGNVVIAGHNYRNGTFFSNNKKLSNGDKIYITDLEGKKVTYVIYNKYQTDENDTKSYNKDTNGKREITLSTCTDDSKARIIIEAREE